MAGELRVGNSSITLQEGKVMKSGSQIATIRDGKVFIGGSAKLYLEGAKIRKDGRILFSIDPDQKTVRDSTGAILFKVENEKVISGGSQIGSIDGLTPVEVCILFSFLKSL